ncbi:L,D-transpeptidase [Bradyrhizobium tropiciagri]|uniref:L,D-transpeptidase n=1 Tax=Bradyrhizobium tropiciagri TaxID=312253 RepID=UPI001FCD66DF
MRLAVAAAIAASTLTLSPARADIVVHIDKSSQRMAVSVDGATRYNWPVSTGRRGYGTPNGVFHPQLLARRWYSRKYYNSPMPYAIFFHGGLAIHGTYEFTRLGGPLRMVACACIPRTQHSSMDWSSATAAAARGSRSLTNFARRANRSRLLPRDNPVTRWQTLMRLRRFRRIHCAGRRRFTLPSPRCCAAALQICAAGRLRSTGRSRAA